jgi:hypothetical protein
MEVHGLPWRVVAGQAPNLHDPRGSWHTWRMHTSDRFSNLLRNLGGGYSFLVDLTKLLVFLGSVLLLHQPRHQCKATAWRLTPLTPTRAYMRADISSTSLRCGDCNVAGSECSYSPNMHGIARYLTRARRGSVEVKFSYSPTVGLGMGSPDERLIVPLT